MSLIERATKRALADAATITAQDAAAPTEILVRRLPGNPCWDLIVDGKTIESSASRSIIANGAINHVSYAGGRATIEYLDQDSMIERVLREQRGQKTVNAVSAGDQYYVIWSRDDQAYTPCASDTEGALALDVQRVGWDPETNMYMHHSGVCSTRGLEAHEIVTLVRSDA